MQLSDFNKGWKLKIHLERTNKQKHALLLLYHKETKRPCSELFSFDHKAISNGNMNNVFNKKENENPI